MLVLKFVCALSSFHFEVTKSIDEKRQSSRRNDKAVSAYLEKANNMGAQFGEHTIELNAQLSIVLDHC